MFELGAKRRSEILSMLHHKVRIQPEHCSRIPAEDQDPDRIVALLEAHGAGESCHVVGGALDGTDSPLADALDTLMGMGDGFFISCIPGRLGYSEFAGPGARYLLRRSVSSAGA